MPCLAATALAATSAASEMKSVCDGTSAGGSLSLSAASTCCARRRLRGQITVLVGRTPLRLGPQRGLGADTRLDFLDEHGIK